MKAIGTGAQSVSYHHEEDGKTFIGERVNVDGVLDRVQRMRHADINNETLGHCIAALPISAIQQWGQQFGMGWEQVANDDKLLDRCIADYSKFKVRGGWQ